MAAIRGKDTTPEMTLRKALFAVGYRYRIHVKHLPGSPDIVLPRYNSVIFVHGCFWHGHDCKIAKTPKSNIKFWKEKIERNKTRDSRVIEELMEMGWKVIIVWECSLIGKIKDMTIARVIDRLKSDEGYKLYS